MSRQIEAYRTALQHSYYIIVSWKNLAFKCLFYRIIYNFKTFVNGYNQKISEFIFFKSLLFNLLVLSKSICFEILPVCWLWDSHLAEQGYKYA